MTSAATPTRAVARRPHPATPHPLQGNAERACSKKQGQSQRVRAHAMVRAYRQRRDQRHCLEVAELVDGVGPGTVNAMDSAVQYRWRADFDDAEMVQLVDSYGGNSEPGWWDTIRPHSLGWVTAHLAEGTLVGFVNVAWDGSDHAFLIDTKVRLDLQRRGIATRLVRVAAVHAKRAGCGRLHVDFRSELAPFYFDACGFEPVVAGAIDLYELEDEVTLE